MSNFGLQVPNGSICMMILCMFNHFGIVMFVADAITCKYFGLQLPTVAVTLTARSTMQDETTTSLGNSHPIIFFYSFQQHSQGSQFHQQIANSIQNTF